MFSVADNGAYAYTAGAPDRPADVAAGRRGRPPAILTALNADLLGHKSARVTTHYSAAEIQNLVDAAEKVCGKNSRKTPAVTLIRIANRA